MTIKRMVAAIFPGLLRAARGPATTGKAWATTQFEGLFLSTVLRGVRGEPRTKLPRRVEEGIQAFLEKMRPYAQEASRETGLAANFLIGQAALETGWGQREVVGHDGTRSHNVFGIKAGENWHGATVDTLTTEYVNGKATTVLQKFRAYGSYAEAFGDYARLMCGSTGRSGGGTNAAADPSPSDGQVLT